MNKKEMEKFRKLLLEKREDLLKVVRAKKEQDLTEAEIGDEIDTASTTSEKELLFEQTDNEKMILDAIESALRRLEKGKFGKCESCGQDIKEGRLNAIEGNVPNPAELPGGCKFHPRCAYARERCRTEEPIWEFDAAEGRGQRCFFWREITA